MHLNMSEVPKHKYIALYMATLFHTFLAKILLFRQLFLKVLSEMANSVDLERTVPDGT